MTEAQKIKQSYRTFYFILFYFSVTFILSRGPPLKQGRSYTQGAQPQARDPSLRATRPQTLPICPYMTASNESVSGSADACQKL